MRPLDYQDFNEQDEATVMLTPVELRLCTRYSMQVQSLATKLLNAVTTDDLRTVEIQLRQQAEQLYLFVGGR